MIQFTVNIGDESRSIQVDALEAFIGRPNDDRPIDVDLSPDGNVSRVHARVWLENGFLKIEDLGSSQGTQVNSSPLKKIVVIRPADRIKIGDSILFARLGPPRPKDAPKVERAPVAKPPTPKINPSIPAETGVGIQIEVEQNGETKRLSIPKEEAFIGRKNESHPIDVDLTGDLNVSRIHARIWVSQGKCWVEDLQSSHGTQLNGENIGGLKVVGTTDIIEIGSYRLKVSIGGGLQSNPEMAQTAGAHQSSTAGGNVPLLQFYPVYKEVSYRYFAPENRNADQMSNYYSTIKSPIGMVLVERECSMNIGEWPALANPHKAQTLLKGLVEFPLKLASATDVAGVCTLAVEHLVKVMPGISRASVFLIDSNDSRLMLKAHQPSLKPSVSETLMHRAFDSKNLAIWHQADPTECVQRMSIHTGIYAPIVGCDREIGMLCLDSTDQKLELLDEDAVFAAAIALQLGAFLQQKFAAKESIWTGW